jgi:hypothetical protein
MHRQTTSTAYLFDESVIGHRLVFDIIGHLVVEGDSQEDLIVVIEASVGKEVWVEGCISGEGLDNFGSAFDLLFIG